MTDLVINLVYPSNKVAYDRGSKDYAKGRLVVDNPYVTDHEITCWMYGWLDAMNSKLVKMNSKLVKSAKQSKSAKDASDEIVTRMRFE